MSFRGCHKTQLQDSKYNNWVKGGLALKYLKAGIGEFADEVVNDEHSRILQTLGLTPGSTCNVCKLKTLKPPHAPAPKVKQCPIGQRNCNCLLSNTISCSNNICGLIYDEIVKTHGTLQPFWKNTDITKWTTHPWEIAKCFINVPGYDRKTSAADTDVAGLLHLFINCTFFQGRVSSSINLFDKLVQGVGLVGLSSHAKACKGRADSVLFECLYSLLQIRELRNSVFHSPSMELEDQQLTDGIHDIITLLEDDKELKAKTCSKQAVLNLKNLQQENFIITTETEAEVCRAALASITLATNELKNTRDEAIKDIAFKQEEALKKVQETSESGSARLQFELSELRTRVDKHDLEINVLQTRVRAIEIDVAKLKQAQDHQTEHLREIEHILNLKEDIISYYREHESVIPASPLVDEHNVHIESFYVIPPMWAYTDSYFGQDNNRQKGDKTSGNDGQDKQEITISELFLSGDVRYRKIYITANAGFGKTSLSQKLTMIWCQSQSPLKLVSEEAELDSEETDLGSKETDRDFEETDLDYDETDLDYDKTDLNYDETDLDSEESDLDSEETDLDSEEGDLESEEDELESQDVALNTLRYFDLLFLLHLRDYQCESICNLDDLITKMVLDKLSRNALYTKEFLQKCLHEKQCLIILDGLDEWAHPGQCTRKPEVPHNNHPDSCTVLTTTRDWKIGTIGLSPKDIDRRVEISMLDDETRTELEKNAVRILNERNLNLAGKNIADFDEEVRNVQIGNIIYIPYILLQLMCLFFGGLPIGKSKCEIYSNITEFTLKRGLKKKDLPDIHVYMSNDNAAVPNCLKHNKKCNLYFNPIMKLGKLAFCALFGEKKESSLIFDRKYAKLFMTKEEIEFCLKVGLLCQTKDSSIIAVKRYQVFFQHKSVQEFFSAIYITSEWQNESVKLTLLNVCSSLSGILQMSNVFVFVCGINPEVYACISDELQTIVDLDGVTRRCRIGRNRDDVRTLLSYQSMQMQCLQESMRNGNASCPIDLYVVLNRDVYLESVDLSTLKTVINYNQGHVKSLLVSISYWETDFMQLLDPGVFASLETLRAEHCFGKPVWLADILTESARTLVCFTLSSPNERYSFPLSLFEISKTALPAIIITALAGLTCLQSLYLVDDRMTHSNLKCLYAYISRTTTLTQLKLEWIECLDHSVQYRDCDVNLDLHRLNVLKMLDLFYVPCRELHVNPACLEKLEFWPTRGEKMTARASAILWQDLRAAPVLSSLTLSDMTTCQEMIQTIPALTQLQHLKLAGIDLNHFIPRVSPEMTQLERVVLDSVTMSIAAWQTLFVSVDQLPRSITVELSLITKTSQEWRELLLRVGQLQHPVTVELYRCRGPSEEEWLTIVNLIKTTPTLSLLPDLRIYVTGSASLTLKNKTV